MLKTCHGERLILLTYLELTHSDKMPDRFEIYQAAIRDQA